MIDFVQVPLFVRFVTPTMENNEVNTHNGNIYYIVWLHDEKLTELDLSRSLLENFPALLIVHLTCLDTK